MDVRIVKKSYKWEAVWTELLNAQVESLKGKWFSEIVLISM